MPRDDGLGGRDVELLRNLLDLGDVERLLDLVVASEGRVCLEKEVVLLRPLEQLGLRVPEIQLDLIHSGLVLEWVRREILDPRRRLGDITSGGLGCVPSDVEATWESAMVRRIVRSTLTC